MAHGRRLLNTSDHLAPFDTTDVVIIQQLGAGLCRGRLPGSRTRSRCARLGQGLAASPAWLDRTGRSNAEVPGFRPGTSDRSHPAPASLQ